MKKFILKNPPLKNCWHILLVIAGILFILLAVSIDLHRLFILHDRHDFEIFYDAARTLIQGGNLYQIDHGAYIYPPFFAFILTPLGHLSPKFAHVIWMCVNIGLTVLILILGFRILASGFKLIFSRWQAAGACALALLLSQDQILREFGQCQNDLLILAGFTLALYWLDRKPLIAGALLGLITDIKYQALFFLPFLLFRARWRTTIGILAGILIGALLPALMIGWSRNLEYLQIALRGLLNLNASTLATDHAAIPTILWTGNVSISSGLARIFVMLNWSINDALILTLLIASVSFYFLWWSFKSRGVTFIWRTPHTFKNPQQEKAIINLEWCTLLVCMLVFSPECARRHMVLLLNVNLLAAVMLLFPRQHVKRWPVLVAIIIAQLGQFRFGFFPGFPTGDFVGLPGWSFLVFMFILINNALAYYRDVYPAAHITKPTPHPGKNSIPDCP